MIKTIMLLASLFIASFSLISKDLSSDIVSLKNGELKISFVGHGSIFFDYKGYLIYVDPVGRYGDYKKFKDADLILITHSHGDHLDSIAVKQIEKKGTKIYLNKESYNILKKGIVLKNTDKIEIDSIKITAVPAYNTTKTQFHPKERDNGYILEIDEKRIYVAGDCENMEEMDKLTGLDIAFLPVNQPYTMTVEQAIEAINRMKPKIVYPYHYGDTDVSKIKEYFKDFNDIEIRIRDLK